MVDPITSSEVQDCIRSCLDCYSTCQETLNYCLQMAGKHSELSHIRLLMDCVEICETNASYMLRNSDLYMSTCSVCAEVCDGAAESCEQFESDPRMAVAAEQCRRTADLCDRVSQQSLAA